MIQKKSFPEVVAEELIEQLKAGTAPWQRPWRPGVAPVNHVTGKRYRGINTVHLLAQSRSDPRWITYKQAQGIGAQVRRGEKGTLIQFWQFHEEREKLDGNGRPETELVKLERPRVISAVVFNAEQIDGLPAIQPKVPDWDLVDRAEAILLASGANIQHTGGHRAYYRYDTDTIHLPGRDQFNSADGYYAIALHELGHWTGHESRLARDMAHPLGSEGYAKEELRAEIASMMLGEDLGIGHDPKQHTAYVASWIEALQNDHLEIFRAASDAEKIRGYVLSLERVQVQEQEQQQKRSNAMIQNTVDRARSFEEVVRDDSTSTDDEKIAAKAARKAAEAAAFYKEHPEEKPEQSSIRHRFGNLELDKARPEFLPPSAEKVEPQTEKVERHYISVPFPEKDEAKALGARWDKAAQSWYVPPGVDVGAFGKWAKSHPEVPAAPTKKDTNEIKPSRVYLSVPYNERAAAKAVGAKWDKEAKSWYAGAKAAEQSEKIRRWLPDSRAAQQDPAMTPREEFAEALISMGCKVDGDHPIADGNRHRIGVDGDKPGEQAGFYVLHLDGHPAGYIKNNRTGIDMKWKSKGYVLDEKTKAQLNAEAATKLAQRKAEQEEAHKVSAERVRKQLGHLVPIGGKQTTPYLEKKGISVHSGIYTDADGTKTYVPAYDADGKQWSMQYIQEDGTKRFAKDSRKEGCFHPIGGMGAIKAAPVLVIGEGLATAASLSEALGQGTVAAFDSGNLKAVAVALHAKYPDKPIIIAGDDDRHLENTQGVNPGRVKATEAAKAVGGQTVFPVFAPGEQQGDPKGFTDFNDLAQKSALGVEAVKRQVGVVVVAAQQRRDEKVAEQIKTEQKPEQKRRAAKVG